MVISGEIMGAVYSRMNPTGFSLNLAKPIKSKSFGGRSISTGSGNRGDLMYPRSDQDNSEPSARITRSASRVQSMNRRNAGQPGPRRSSRLIAGQNESSSHSSSRPVVSTSLNEALTLQSRLRRSARIARINSVGTSTSRHGVQRKSRNGPTGSMIRRRGSRRRSSPN